MHLNHIRGSDLIVSELCLGTMTFGQQNSQQDAVALLDYAYDNGINFFDTAEMYPVPVSSATQGLSERYLGCWLSGKERGKVVVATKISGPGRGLHWLREDSQRLSPTDICQAVDESLTRLGTDYIDIYQIHWPHRYVPQFGETSYDIRKERDTIKIEAQLQGLSEVCKAGKVRYIGLSNETPWGLFSFSRLAQFYQIRVISLQNAYSLLNRVCEFSLVEMCMRESIGYVAYSPLAFGLLSGKYLRKATPSNSRLALFQGYGGRYDKQNVDAAVYAYDCLAQDYGIPTAQLALAFVRSRPFIVSTIIGATRLDQLVQNMASIDVSWDDSIEQAINAIHEKYPNPAP